MLIDRNSWAYTFGRVVGKGFILVVGIVIGKRYFQRPIDKGFPNK